MCALGVDVVVVFDQKVVYLDVPYSDSGMEVVEAVCRVARKS